LARGGSRAPNCATTDQFVLSKAKIFSIIGDLTAKEIESVAKYVVAHK
jgi:hypothetical protein